MGSAAELLWLLLWEAGQAMAEGLGGIKAFPCVLPWVVWPAGPKPRAQGP